MKRSQLIEWGIVTIGLIFGYKFFEGVFTALVQIFYGFQAGGIDMFSVMLPTLILVAIYGVFFIMVIRKSSQIASYLAGTEKQEAVPLKIGKRSLLQIVLIALCVATVLSDVAEILLYLFETFKNEAGRKRYFETDTTTVTKYAFKIAAIQTIVALVVLYFSKEISGWFIRKNEADELTFDSSPEKEQ